MSDLQPTPLTAQEQRDEEMIQAAFQKLLDTYLASNHRKKTEIITRAFNFAKHAHKGVRRLSGEPYILHPIAVAQVACEEIGLGSTSICAALLHDVEEDTEYTHEDLCNLFGKKIANIVEGVTKISGGIFGNNASEQAETFKKILLTMSDDVRVILIKISDRVHNMRTLESMAPSRQYKIAGETMYIYAPIADRLGLNKIKTELEDLSFKYEHPKEYERLTERLADTRCERDDAFKNFIPPITEALDEMGVDYNILQRIKTPYSIWHKMQKKHISFDEVYDILAIRIVFTPKDREKEIEESFRIYSALTKIYHPHPTRFRDWVSSPKANGYQALHNTFMSKRGQWIEVQIRSVRMDDIAEQGFAAHWKYKDANASNEEHELEPWLNSIKEILDDPQPDTLDLLDTIKLNLFSKEIMVFTPKGEIKTLPNDATVLDFAFSIHTMLGSHCFGAKVNHKLEPLNYRLSSGDQVEVLSSRTQHVQPEWLNFVNTAKARGKIQALLRQSNREKTRKGEMLLRDFLLENQIDPNQANIEKLRTFHKYPTPDALYFALGNNSLSLGEREIDMLHNRLRKKGWRRYVPFMGGTVNLEAIEKQAAAARESSKEFIKGLNKKKTLVLTNDILEAHCTMSGCCAPIPGDDALGYITSDYKIAIHKRECPEALKLKTRFGNNIIDVSWNMHRLRQFETFIFVKGFDSDGVLSAMSDTLRKVGNYPLKRINIEANDGIFEGTLTFQVYEKDDVAKLCKALIALDCINAAHRIDPS